MLPAKNCSLRRRTFLAASLAAALPRGRAGRAADAGPISAQAVSVDSDRFRAQLAAVAPGGELRFRCDGAERRLAATDLVSWGAPAEPSAANQVFLADGSTLVAAQLLGSDQGDLTFDSEPFGEVKLALALVTGIMLHPPLDRDERDRLALRLSAGSGEPSGAGRSSGVKRNARSFTDQMLLVNGDELAGKLKRLTASSMEFETDVGLIAPDYDKVAALALARPPERAPVGLRWATGLGDGSLVIAESLVVDDVRAKVRLAGPLELEAEAGAIVSVQPLGGRATYLSDLQVESYRCVPFLDLAWPYRRDACVAGSRLRADGRAYLKGIGMHSASRLTYRIDGRPYARFDANVAIDDRTEGRGSVVFRVFVDDHEACRSDTIRGGMPPVPISVDLAGGKRLSLIVDFADRGDELDHADWLDARLIQ